jgi:hypothetical protein
MVREITLRKAGGSVTATLPKDIAAPVPNGAGARALPHGRSAVRPHDNRQCGAEATSLEPISRLLALAPSCQDLRTGAVRATMEPSGSFVAQADQK